jgi:hypothetical protein
MTESELKSIFAAEIADALANLGGELAAQPAERDAAVDCSAESISPRRRV